jgi:hypothetical protein
MDALSFSADGPLPDDVPTLQTLLRQALAEMAHLRAENVLAAHSDRDKNALCPGTGRGWWIAGLSHL